MNEVGCPVEYNTQNGASCVLREIDRSLGAPSEEQHPIKKLDFYRLLTYHHAATHIGIQPLVGCPVEYNTHIISFADGFCGE